MAPDRAGHPPSLSRPITIIVPVARWWAWWLRLTWQFADRSRWIKAKLLGFEFIHVAHWSLVDRLPAAAPRDEALALPTPYLLFQTNYNGDAANYVETFALEAAWRIDGIWRGAYDFPGPRPSSRFVAFVLERALEGPPQSNAYHYYAGYPSGTVRTVKAALKLRAGLPELERQAAEAARLGPYALADVWGAFLADQQRNL